MAKRSRDSHWIGASVGREPGESEALEIDESRVMKPGEPEENQKGRMRGGYEQRGFFVKHVFLQLASECESRREVYPGEDVCGDQWKR